ncbi:MAG: glycosyltransferase family 4 protein [Gemmatimonadaceae bacterium]
MRHLFVTQDYAPDLGGMARRHVELCRRFAPDSVVVSTVGATHAAAFDAGEAYPIERQPFPFARSKRFASQVAWSHDLVALCRAGADVMHLGNVRPCGYAVALAARRTGTPYLVYVNGGDLLREQRKSQGDALKRWSARRILGDSLGVVAISAWSAALARQVMSEVGVRRPPPVAEIELGTDPAHFSPARDRGALRRRLGILDAPLLLTVARLVPHKGQDVVIQALAAMSDTRPDVRYLVVGEGHDRQRLEQLAQAAGVADRLIFAGPMSDDEVAEAYATADVYVGLSRVDNGINVEGFGISFVEASASGTPSIAGDSGGVRSAVRDGITGMVVPPTDTGAVVAALARLLGDDNLRRHMGAAGRQAVESHYNWDRVARETVAFTHERLSAGGAA